MKFISIKLKTIVPTFITISSAVLTLSSCAKNKDELPYDSLVEYDKEFGYDAAKYARLVKSFTNAYQDKITRQADSIHKQSEEFISKSMLRFKNEIDHLNQAFNLKQKQSNVQLSWTSKSDALLSYAYNSYKIVLSSETEDWEVTLNNIYTSYLNTLKINMDNLNISEEDQKEQIKNFSGTFAVVKVNAKIKYGTVIEALPYVRSCLDNAIISINDKCSYLATADQLKRFLDNFKIETIASPADKYYWDQLKIDENFGRSKSDRVDISKYLEHIFVFREKINSDISPIDSTLEEIDKQSYGEPIVPTEDKLKGDLIQGFELTPILKGMTEDPITNTYGILIDWELINKKDKDKPNKSSLTAHSSVIKKELNVEKDLIKNDAKNGTSDNYLTVVDNYNSTPDEDKQFSEYILPITNDFEIQNLKATYLNDSAKNKITFAFDVDEKLAYDTYLLLYGFYKDKDNPDSEEIIDIPTKDEDGKEIKQISFLLSAEDLGNIGVTINGQRLDNLLKDAKSKEEQSEKDINDSDIDVDNLNPLNNNLQNDADLPNTSSTHEQTFLTNCDIWGKVELNLNDEKRYVKNHIYYSYKNTTNSREDIENKYLKDSIILEKENMQLSDKYFENAQSYYNKANEVSTYYNTMPLSSIRWAILLQAAMFTISLASSYFAASKLSAKFLAATWSAGIVLSIFYFALLVVVTSYIWLCIPVAAYLYIVLCYICELTHSIQQINAITEKSKFYNTLKDDEKSLIFIEKTKFQELNFEQMYEKVKYYSKIDSNKDYIEYITPYKEKGVDPNSLMEQFTSSTSPLTIVQVVMGYWSMAQGIIVIPLMIDPDANTVRFASNWAAVIWGVVKGVIYSTIFGALFRLLPMFLTKILIPDSGKLPDVE